MLSPEEVAEVTADLWQRHVAELPRHDRIAGFVSGRLGRPSVPEGASDELKELARLAVKNVLSLVRDAFAQNLSVVGFRSPDETENAEVWGLWQQFRMDARQAEVHRAAITYGVAYTVVRKDAVHIRSPRQLLAVYRDPDVDLWPVYALDTWVDDSGKQPVWRATLYDDEFAYPVVLGTMPRVQGGDSDALFRQRVSIQVRYNEDETERHGAGACPVVRFVNARDAEQLVVGEIEPLIDQQKAINTVNFDRLVVSRFGAFPQRYAIGWAASSKDEFVRASMARLMSFEDPDVKAGAFPAASVEPYNAILGEMLRHVAMTAQIPPLALTGDIENIAAEAAAMIDAPHQRKLAVKRESFGESWEQHLMLHGMLNDIEVSPESEVVWRNTENRSFGAVVDGIGKLTAAGVPIETLLDDIPGWTQQRADNARAALRRQRGTGVLDALRAAAGVAGDEPTVGATEDSLKERFEALGVAIRAGVEPEDAARRLGLEGIRFTGAVPVSLRPMKSDADED